MQPEPLFQSFDAGWIIIAGVALLFGALWWDIKCRDCAEVHDDPDWDVEPRKRDPESEARHWPF